MSGSIFQEVSVKAFLNDQFSARSLGQQHWHHLGTNKKCKFEDATLRVSGRWSGPIICALAIPPRILT